MEVALRGQLGEKLVADLIREIAEQKSTGLLRLSQDKTIKAIFFESGTPVFAISSLPHEQIDHKLIKGRFAAAGLVESADGETFERRARTEGLVRRFQTVQQHEGRHAAVESTTRTSAAAQRRRENGSCAGTGGPRS